MAASSQQATTQVNTSVNRKETPAFQSSLVSLDQHNETLPYLNLMVANPISNKSSQFGKLKCDEKSTADSHAFIADGQRKTSDLYTCPDLNYPSEGVSNISPDQMAMTDIDDPFLDVDLASN